jgi:2,3-diaminopropionate biosynthesis protein SbnB
MKTDNMLIVRGDQVVSLLEGRESELMGVIQAAYESHARGNSALPHSIFLRFPDNQANRIIGLPAYLGDGFDICGIKWIASFPANIAAGLDRASAVLILNSTQTGRPEAIMEGAVISAKRTAASAALAAKYLQDGKQTTNIGIVGCGLINFEIVRFLLATLPEARSLTIYDLDHSRAMYFKHKCERTFHRIEVHIADRIDSVLHDTSLIAMATTAGEPHITDLSACAPGSTILHVSLRDLAPEVILAVDNVVDDVDHVCRARTSIHLAEQLVGNREFIRCTLADVTLGKSPARRDEESIAVFSPFGMGILDIAVGRLVRDLALEAGQGQMIETFFAAPWRE